MYNLPQALRIAMRALRVNKMRSFLTMLGIIIGIAAVIAMMAVGSGASYIISQQIASIGSNIILVLPGSLTSGGLRTGSGGVQTLKAADSRAIQQECPAVAKPDGLLVAPHGQSPQVAGQLRVFAGINRVLPVFAGVAGRQGIRQAVIGDCAVLAAPLADKAGLVGIQGFPDLRGVQFIARAGPAARAGIGGFEFRKVLLPALPKRLHGVYAKARRAILPHYGAKLGLVQSPAVGPFSLGQSVPLSESGLFQAFQFGLGA